MRPQWTALFIPLGGGALGSLVVGRWRLPRFYLLFGPAFFAYAAGWVGTYFARRGATGKWVGSLAGSALTGSGLAAGFGPARAAPNLSTALFPANSVEYFSGSAIIGMVGGSGCCSGAARAGYAWGRDSVRPLHVAQTRRAASS